MSSTLGEKLRQAREERGISISEVAEQTRISPLYLESIENDNYKPLPGGIFNKGFLKSYAKYIGYDEQEALQEYAQLVSSSESSAETEEIRGYRPEVLTDGYSSSSMAPTLIFAGIILALMTGGVLFLVNYIQNQPDEPDQTVATPANSNAPAANADPAPAAPIPADRIGVELKAVSEPVWVSYTVDGTKNIKTLAENESLALDAKDSFKISYSRSKLPNLQIFLNGTRIEPPNTDKGTVEFEINKNNIAQFVPAADRSSASSAVDPKPAVTTAAATQAPREPAATPSPAKPKPSPAAAAAKPSPKPAATERRAAAKPTPIVIGNTPRTRPSPN